MTPSSRRRTLAVAGSAVVGAIAGCLDELSTTDGSDDGTAVPDGAVGDAVVNYPEFVDGDVTVSESETRVQYADPDEEFHLSAAVDGDEVDGDDDELRISRTLDGAAMTAFLAPAYDDGFSYHVFANAAFVDDADWRVLSVADEDVDDRGADFEEVSDGVYYLEVTPETDVDAIAITDDAPDLEGPDDDSADMTGVAIQRGICDGDEAHGPQVYVDFHRTDDTVEIMHTAGDELDNSAITVLVDGEEIEAPFDTETVTVGDTATIDDVPDGTTVQLVYESSSGEQTVLTSYTAE